jgi:hypothetical protein
VIVVVLGHVRVTRVIDSPVIARVPNAEVRACLRARSASLVLRWRGVASAKRELRAAVASASRKEDARKHNEPRSAPRRDASKQNEAGARPTPTSARDRLRVQ